MAFRATLKGVGFAATLSVLAAAGIGSGSAQALEPPKPQVARACPRYGAGFVEVPGTTTCVRIGGRVVTEYGTTRRQFSRDQIAGFGATGRVSVDTRTDTPYGTFRSFVRVRAGGASRD